MVEAPSGAAVVWLLVFSSLIPAAEAYDAGDALALLLCTVLAGGGGGADWKSNLNLCKCGTRCFPTRKDASSLGEGWTALLPSFVLEIPRRHDKKSMSLSSGSVAACLCFSSHLGFSFTPLT
uniref:Secreted protein n=1 Tax=Poecilia reticulata TaxID=8081 RepID=A0A3P9P029_POERE